MLACISSGSNSLFKYLQIRNGLFHCLFMLGEENLFLAERKRWSQRKYKWWSYDFQTISIRALRLLYICSYPKGQTFVVTYVAQMCFNTQSPFWTCESICKVIMGFGQSFPNYLLNMYSVVILNMRYIYCIELIRKRIHDLQFYEGACYYENEQYAISYAILLWHDLHCINMLQYMMLNSGVLLYMDYIPLLLCLFTRCKTRIPNHNFLYVVITYRHALV